MPFVLDDSVTMTWCFEDEAGPYGDRVLELLYRDVAMVPAIWSLGVGNVLLVAERQRRLQAEDVARAIEWIRTLPITVDSVNVARDLGVVLELARAHKLTNYGASYLELAMREALPLATQDARLIAAARRTGVPLLP